MTYSGISLVTGAVGFLGSHVVECLAKNGVSVRATARPRQDISFFERLGVATCQNLPHFCRCLRGMWTGCSMWTAFVIFQPLMKNYTPSMSKGWKRLPGWHWRKKLSSYL